VAPPGRLLPMHLCCAISGSRNNNRPTGSGSPTCRLQSRYTRVAVRPCRSDPIVGEHDRLCLIKSKDGRTLRWVSPPAGPRSCIGCHNPRDPPAVWRHPATSLLVQWAGTVGAAAIVWALFRSGPQQLAGAGLPVAALLATPYGYVYDMPILTTAVIWVVAERHRAGDAFGTGEVFVMLEHFWVR
jgi:hypothetical protein